jgi:hypothetical protein
MVDPGRGDTAKRLSAVLKRGPLVVIGCCVALGGAAPARAAVSGPIRASEGLVSGRYQVVPCDTAATGALDRMAVGRRTALAVGNPGFPALGAGFSSGESRQGNTRYQLRNVISNSRWAVLIEIPAATARSAVRTCVDNTGQISRASSKTTAPSAPSDARRLFQLAVALAAAYVLFLAAWFWGTRERRGRVGSAARS